MYSHIQWNLYNKTGKVLLKHINFIICLRQSLQYHVYSPCHEWPPVLRDHKIWWSLYTGFTVCMFLLQYIPRNMHMVFALLCFVVVIHWLIFPYPSGLLHWHCGNLTIAPVPAKQPWWIWINTSCEFIMNDCITTTKQSTTKPCAYFLGSTVTSMQQNMRICLSWTNHGWNKW